MKTYKIITKVNKLEHSVEVKIVITHPGASEKDLEYIGMCRRNHLESGMRTINSNLRVENAPQYLEAE